MAKLQDYGLKASEFKLHYRHYFSKNTLGTEKKTLILPGIS